VTIYIDPSDVDGELVAMLEVRDEAYSFDLVGVWRRVSDGALFGAADSGCSCPTPFEDYERLEDMEPIRSVADAERLIWCPDPSGDKQDFLAAVRRALG
jgi:hypothetical protein